MNKIIKPFSTGSMKSLSEFSSALKDAGIELPLSANMQTLAEPCFLDGKTIPNRLAIHPCEGFDAGLDGKPSERIFRRYGRYARGGAGMIWFEAISVCEDGICNPHQMRINENTVDEIRRLVYYTDTEAMRTHGFKPYKIIQLTHSGRCAVNMAWEKTPLVAFPNPYLDPYYPNVTVATDERIEQLEQEMIQAAWLSMQAGFDAVDLKLCHNYIMRDLLAGFTRPGKYGGSFENRTRFVRNVLDGIRAKCGDGIAICTRLNAYDCVPYPYGWGMVQKDGALDYDLEEPIRLVKMLVEHGVRLINVSTMMPRYSPKETGFIDAYRKEAELHPYESTALLLKATMELRKAVPGALMVATGLSWFGQFGGCVGAGGIENGWFDFAGFGRQAFAYPDFADDILKSGGMDPKKCCVNCDKCYELIDMHENSGCPVRDMAEYLPDYKRGLERMRSPAKE